MADAGSEKEGVSARLSIGTKGQSTSQKRKSNSRRSSILKSPTRNALGDLDPNVKADSEPTTKLAKGRRVSFARTYQVKEFDDVHGAVAAPPIDPGPDDDGDDDDPEVQINHHSISGLGKLLTGPICSQLLYDAHEIQELPLPNDSDCSSLCHSSNNASNTTQNSTFHTDESAIPHLTIDSSKKVDISAFLQALKNKSAQIPSSQVPFSEVLLPSKQFPTVTEKGVYSMTDNTDFETIVNTSLNKYSVSPTHTYAESSTGQTVAVTQSLNTAVSSECSLRRRGETTRLFGHSQSAMMDLSCHESTTSLFSEDYVHSNDQPRVNMKSFLSKLTGGATLPSSRVDDKENDQPRVDMKSFLSRLQGTSSNLAPGQNDWQLPQTAYGPLGSSMGDFAAPSTIQPTWPVAGSSEEFGSEKTRIFGADGDMDFTCHGATENIEQTIEPKINFQDFSNKIQPKQPSSRDLSPQSAGVVDATNTRDCMNLGIGSSGLGSSQFRCSTVCSEGNSHPRGEQPGIQDVYMEENTATMEFTSCQGSIVVGNDGELSQQSVPTPPSELLSNPSTTITRKPVSFEDKENVHIANDTRNHEFMNPHLQQQQQHQAEKMHNNVMNKTKYFHEEADDADMDMTCVLPLAKRRRSSVGNCTMSREVDMDMTCVQDAGNSTSGRMVGRPSLQPGSGTSFDKTHCFDDNDTEMTCFVSRSKSRLRHSIVNSTMYGDVHMNMTCAEQFTGDRTMSESIRKQEPQKNTSCYDATQCFDNYDMEMTRIVPRTETSPCVPISGWENTLTRPVQSNSDQTQKFTDFDMEMTCAVPSTISTLPLLCQGSLNTREVVGPNATASDATQNFDNQDMEITGVVPQSKLHLQPNMSGTGDHSKSVSRSTTDSTQRFSDLDMEMTCIVPPVNSGVNENQNCGPSNMLKGKNARNQQAGTSDATQRFNDLDMKMTCIVTQKSSTVENQTSTSQLQKEEENRSTVPGDNVDLTQKFDDCDMEMTCAVPLVNNIQQGNCQTMENPRTEITTDATQKFDDHDMEMTCAVPIALVNNLQQGNLSRNGHVKSTGNRQTPVITDATKRFDDLDMEMTDTIPSTGATNLVSDGQNLPRSVTTDATQRFSDLDMELTCAVNPDNDRLTGTQSLKQMNDNSPVLLGTEATQRFHDQDMELTRTVLNCENRTALSDADMEKTGVQQTEQLSERSSAVVAAGSTSPIQGDKTHYFDVDAGMEFTSCLGNTEAVGTDGHDPDMNETLIPPSDSPPKTTSGRQKRALSMFRKSFGPSHYPPEKIAKLLGEQKFVSNTKHLQNKLDSLKVQKDLESFNLPKLTVANRGTELMIESRNTSVNACNTMVTSSRTAQLLISCRADQQGNRPTITNLGMAQSHSTARMDQSQPLAEKYQSQVTVGIDQSDVLDVEKTRIPSEEEGILDESLPEMSLTADLGQALPLTGELTTGIVTKSSRDQESTREDVEPLSGSVVEPDVISVMTNILFALPSEEDRREISDAATSITDGRPPAAVMESMEPTMYVVHDKGPDMSVIQSNRPDMSIMIDKGHMSITQGKGSEVSILQEKGPDVCTIQDKGPDMSIVHGKGPDMSITQDGGPDMSTGPDMSITQGIGPETSLLQDKRPDMSTIQGKGPDMSLIQGKGPDMSITQARGPDMSIKQDKFILQDKEPAMSTLQGKGPDMSIIQGKGPDFSIIQDKGPDVSILHGSEPDMSMIHSKGSDMSIIQDKGPAMSLKQVQGPAVSTIQGKGLDMFIQGSRPDMSMTQDDGPDMSILQDIGSEMSMIQDNGPWTDIPIIQDKGPEMSIMHGKDPDISIIQDKGPDMYLMQDREPNIVTLNGEPAISMMASQEASMPIIQYKVSALPSVQNRETTMPRIPVHDQVMSRSCDTQYEIGHWTVNGPARIENGKPAMMENRGPTTCISRVEMREAVISTIEDQDPVMSTIEDQEPPHSLIEDQQERAMSMLEYTKSAMDAGSFHISALATMNQSSNLSRLGLNFSRSIIIEQRDPTLAPTTAKEFCEMVNIPLCLGKFDDRRSSIGPNRMDAESMSLGEMLTHLMVYRTEVDQVDKASSELQQHRQQLLMQISEAEGRIEAKNPELFQKIVESPEQTNMVRQQASECWKACKKMSKAKFKESRLQWVNQERDALKEKHQRLGKAVGEMTDMLEKADSEINTITQVLSGAEREISQLESQPVVSEEEVAQLKDISEQLGQKDQELVRMEEELSSLKQEVSCDLKAEESLTVENDRLEQDVIALSKTPSSEDESRIHYLHKQFTTLRSLSEWSPAYRTKDSIGFLFAEDSIKIDISYFPEEEDVTSDLHEIEKISIKSDLPDNVEVSVRLNYDLVVGAITDEFLLLFETEKDIPKFLLEVSCLVGSARCLCKDLRDADFLHYTRVNGTSVSVDFRNLSKIQKCIVTFDFVPGQFTTRPVHTSVQTIIGVSREEDILAAVGAIKPSLHYLKMLVETVDRVMAS